MIYEVNLYYVIAVIFYLIIGYEISSTVRDDKANYNIDNADILLGTLFWPLVILLRFIARIVEKLSG